MLLVDFDNMDPKIGRPFSEKIQNWTDWLEDGLFSKKRQKRRFVAKRVYWNGRTDRLRSTFERHGYEAFACRPAALVKIKENKSSADIVITLDAIDLVHESRGVKEVIVLTADTDFVPLVNRLQQKNISVVAVGNEDDPSSAIYRERADEVISVGALKEACNYRRRGRRAEAMPPVTEVPTASAPQTAAARGELRAGPAKKKRRSPRKRRASPKTAVDLTSAAKILAEVAMQTPNHDVSRVTVERAMARVEGFSKVPTKQIPAWLGCGNYEGMLRRLAELENGLEVHKSKNGGLRVRFTGEPPQVEVSEPKLIEPT